MSSNEITFIPSKLFMSFKEFYDNSAITSTKLLESSEKEMQRLYQQFCIDILNRVKQGTPPPGALCNSLTYWTRCNNYVFSVRYPLVLYQTYLFELHGLDHNFPFNAGDVTGESLTYGNEVRLGELYKNPRRLAWLEKFASV